MGKKILITGGAGFISRNLIKNLLQDKNTLHITVIDNFISSDKEEFQIFKNIYDTDNKVSLLEYDITSRLDMDFVMYNFAFDEIYHMASLASPPFYKKFPLETLDVGYKGTRNILEIAKFQSSVGNGYTQNRNVKVLFTSTSEVYGDPEISPQEETYKGNVNSFGERSSYDCSKRVAEALCYTYIQQFGVDVKIARIFNTYGPEMMLNDGRIITEVIKHLMNDTTLKIFGDGTQTRSICHVNDTVEQLVKLMASNCNIPVNIGNDTELSVNQIVDTIEKVYRQNFDKNSVLKKEYLKLTQDDPLRRKPCLKRNKKILGNHKYMSIEDGLYSTIHYFCSASN